MPPAEQDEPTELRTATADVQLLAETFVSFMEELIKAQRPTQIDLAEITKVASAGIDLAYKDLREYHGTTASADFIRLRDRFSYWFIQLEAETEQEATDMASSNADVFMMTAALGTDNHGLYALQRTKIGRYNIDGWPESRTMATPAV